MEICLYFGVQLPMKIRTSSYWPQSFTCRSTFRHLLSCIELIASLPLSPTVATASDFKPLFTYHCPQARAPSSHAGAPQKVLHEFTAQRMLDRADVERCAADKSCDSFARSSLEPKEWSDVGCTAVERRPAFQLPCLSKRGGTTCPGAHMASLRIGF